MMTPTIHLNGTSREELQAQLANALDAGETFRAALQAAAPNGRDYYPQGNGAICRAQCEHFARLERITTTLRELEQIVEATFA